MTEPIKKILIPTDGSADSEAAFPAVMPLVRAFEPQVALLYVIEDPEASFLPPPRVATACTALRSAGVNAYLELREGNAAEEILRVAREKQVDLVAMSTQGRGGIARMIAGSVAEEVLRQADVPILLTRPATVVHDWKNIMVALDGSERAEEVLSDAVGLARTLGASITLIRVAYPVIAGVVGDAPVVFPIEDPMPYLRKVLVKLEGQGVKASALAPEGRAAGEILRHLVTSKISLLCMTTHGRSGLSRLLMGSVAEEIIRKAPCPVFLRRTLRTEGALEPATLGIQIP